MTKLALAFTACMAALANAAAAQDDEATRAARWRDLAQEIFGARQILTGEGKIGLEAPERAYDAALVPIAISVHNPQEVKGVYLVIDNNPAPLAAQVSFGPQGDPSSLKLRVRVDQYTYMHAVEETKDGTLYETHRFVKASGGCSAPSGSYAKDALASIGEMKLRWGEVSHLGEPQQVQLLIRHPNFNGMQRDPATQGYTPARFVKSVDVSLNDANVLHLDSDISLAADPVIIFGVRPQGGGRFAVSVKDSDNAVFEHAFDLGS